MIVIQNIFVFRIQYYCFTRLHMTIYLSLCDFHELLLFSLDIYSLYDCYQLSNTLFYF